MEGPRERLFWPLLALSSLLAILPLAVASGGGPIINPILLALPWLACVVTALALFRWRGLWFLSAAPVALGPAALIVTYLVLCMPKNCL
jgi:hypothetical protein